MYHDTNNIHSVLSSLVDKDFFRENTPRIPKGLSAVEVISEPILIDLHNIDLPMSNQFEFDAEKFYKYFEKDGTHPSQTSKKLKTWDISGWYNPIHFYGFNWGIHIREDSAYGIAYDLLNQVDALTGSDHRKIVDKNLKDPWEGSPEELKKFKKMESYMGPLRSARSEENRVLVCCIGLAYLMIYFHELFHHFVESFGIRSSLITNRPIYISYKDSVYRRYRKSDKNLEEALANAFSYHCLNSVMNRKVFGIDCSKIRRPVLSYMERDFESSAPGYRKAINYLSSENFSEGLGRLMTIIMEANLDYVGKESDLQCISNLLDHLFHSKKVRTVDVMKHNTSIFYYPKTDFFDNKKRILQKLCKKYGNYKLDRIKKHEIWKCPGRKTIVIPKGKSISDGVAESILKSLNPDFRLRNVEALV